MHYPPVELCVMLLIELQKGVFRNPASFHFLAGVAVDKGTNDEVQW